jgi:GTP cyclohydrolase I
MTTSNKDSKDPVWSAARELANLLESIFGDEVWDDSAKRTAERWIAAMKEFVPEDDIPFQFTTFPAIANQLIVVANIEFASLCVHHLFPYSGRVHVGYIPNRLQVGVSKIPRLVHHFAHRPSVQELLTCEVASYLKHNLEAMGVAVVIEATHTCMSCRGVSEHNAIMRTSEMRGVFLTASEARQEFLALAGLI